MILPLKCTINKALCPVSNSIVLTCVVVLLAAISIILGANNRNFLSGQVDWVLSSQPTASAELKVDEPTLNSSVLRRLRNIEIELEHANWTFYMYDDPQISQGHVKHIRKGAVWSRYRYEIDYDLKILELFEKSSLRRTNYSDVDIFVIPTPISHSLASKTLSENTAIKALLRDPIFESTSGNRHLMISTAFVTFRSSTKPYIKSLSRHYTALENVTVASSQNAALIKEACMQIESFLKRYEFYGPELKAELCTSKQGYRVPPVRRYASIGLGHVTDDFPLVPAAVDKFLNSKFFMLYRTRTSSFMNNSTLYRRFPIENMHKDGFPPSIFGFDAPNRTTWVNEFASSKFCLVLRGDSPNSHALLRSVRAGCLPVIISDTYPIYNPALLSSLDMDDFAFFVPEQSFLRDPHGELLKFANLSRQAIYEKIHGVRLAQRILFPDHEQSLIVPALIKEVLATNQPDYLSTALTRARAILARNNITF